MGMGSLYSVGRGFWGSFCNPALNTENSQFMGGASYENRFGIDELSTRSAAILLPAGGSSAGALISHFGQRDYRRESVILTCGRRLGEKIAGGVTTAYFSERVSGEYQNKQFVSFSAGLILTVTEKASIGITVINPVPNSLRTHSQLSSVIAGTGIRLSDAAFFGAEAELSSGNKLTGRTGFEYVADKNFRIRGGFSTENSSFTFGMGYSMRKIILDLGFATHETLGVISSVSIMYEFN